MSEPLHFSEYADDVPPNLGQVQAELRAGLENVVAGIAISFVIAGAAGFIETIIIRAAMQADWRLPIWADNGLSWGVFGLFSAIVLGMFVGSALLFRYALSLRSRRTLICEGGLLYIDSRRKAAIAWIDIEGIFEMETQKYFPLHGIGRHLVPMGIERSYLIRQHDGQEFSLNGNEVKPIGVLRRTLKIIAKAHDIPWQNVQSTAG